MKKICYSLFKASIAYINLIMQWLQMPLIAKKHAHDISGPIIKWMRVMFDCNLKFASLSRPIRCKTIPSCDMDTHKLEDISSFFNLLYVWLVVGTSLVLV